MTPPEAAAAGRRPRATMLGRRRWLTAAAAAKMRSLKLAPTLFLVLMVLCSQWHLASAGLSTLQKRPSLVDTRNVSADERRLDARGTFGVSRRLAMENVQAQRPTEDAKGWGVISSLPERGSAAYLKLLRTDYKFKVQGDYVHYTIDMKVDPCRDAVKAGEAGKDCCYDMNAAGCQHHPNIQAGLDLQIAYFMTAHIPTCAGTEFDSDPNCGTYIEVHWPGEAEVLGDVRIDGEGLVNGYRTGRISTHSLCLGDHELWWVVRTRSGPYVQKIQKFFVESPSCPAPEGSIPPPDSFLPPPAIP
eukprot:TRINITY_DN124741_c0_g1_i1.p1 TRINITY_DN124741_c0_g1~~TRINITY_DN124741_c0_g1_i1.p1  ORF type:complete len:302 (-),score=63.20 TRINITY_DN124741_c0_g1_i1:167-1072(-)